MTVTLILSVCPTDSCLSAKYHQDLSSQYFLLDLNLQFNSLHFKNYKFQQLHEVFGVGSASWFFLRIFINTKGLFWPCGNLSWPCSTHSKYLLHSGPDPDPTHIFLIHVPGDFCLTCIVLEVVLLISYYIPPSLTN